MISGLTNLLFGSSEEQSGLNKSPSVETVLHNDISDDWVIVSKSKSENMPPTVQYQLWVVCGYQTSLKGIY